MRDRERKEEKWGGSETHYMEGGGGQEVLSPVLKVPRHYPLVHLVEIMHTVGINFVCFLEKLNYSEI
jgi:hypothetical protein